MVRWFLVFISGSSAVIEIHLPVLPMYYFWLGYAVYLAFKDVWRNKQIEDEVSYYIAGVCLSLLVFYSYTLYLTVGS